MTHYRTSEKLFSLLLLVLVFSVFYGIYAWEWEKAVFLKNNIFMRFNGVLLVLWKFFYKKK